MANINFGGTPQKAKISTSNNKKPQTSVGVNRSIQTGPTSLQKQKRVSLQKANVNPQRESIVDMVQRPTRGNISQPTSNNAKVNVPKMKQPLLKGNYLPLKKMEMRTKLPAFPVSKRPKLPIE